MISKAHYRGVILRANPVIDPSGTDYGAGRGGAGGHRRPGGSHVCGPGPHRGAGCRGGRRPQHPLAVVKLPDAKRGFVLPPRRWVVEHSNAWLARFRRLARDYELLADSLAGLHRIAFTIIMLARLLPLTAQDILTLC